jgi:hypothetical protein
MTWYTVDFEAMEPQFGSTDLAADSADEAVELAKEYIERYYPEYIDVEVTGVKEQLDG